MAREVVTIDTLLVVAHHEAGHATAAIALGIAVRRVTMRGVVTICPRNLPLAERASLSKRLAVIDLAGPAAEAKLTGQADPIACQADEANALAHARQLLALVGQAGDGAEQMVTMLRPMAAKLVSEHWPAIQAVARALLAGELTGADVQKFLE